MLLSMLKKAGSGGSGDRPHLHAKALKVILRCVRDGSISVEDFESWRNGSESGDMFQHRDEHLYDGFKYL